MLTPETLNAMRDQLAVGFWTVSERGATADCTPQVRQLVAEIDRLRAEVEFQKTVVAGYTDRVTELEAEVERLTEAYESQREETGKLLADRARLRADAERLAEALRVHLSDSEDVDCRCGAGIEELRQHEEQK